MSVEEIRFCPRCGSRLEWRHLDRERLVCPRCGYVYYLKPVVGVGVLVEREGRVVLIRRGQPPKVGFWALPSGYMEADESAEEAAIRECREETGLEVELEGLLGVYSFGDQEIGRGVLILYAARAVGGELRPGDDAQEVGLFAPTELPEEIAFSTHVQALRDWLRARAVEVRPAASPEEARAVEALAEAHRYPAYRHPYPAYLRNGRALLVAYDRERLVGFAALSRRPWDRSVAIDRLFVVPSHRRWGIGSRLLRAAEVQARRWGAEALLARVRAASPALLFYFRNGFRAVGFISPTFGEGEAGAPALYLARRLDREVPDPLAGE